MSQLQFRYPDRPGGRCHGLSAHAMETGLGSSSQPVVSNLGSGTVDFCRSNLAKMACRIPDWLCDTVAAAYAPKPHDFPRAVGLGNETNAFAHEHPRQS